MAKSPGTKKKAKKVAEKKVEKPKKGKAQVSPDQARAILNKEIRARERKCARRIETILKEEGFKLEVQAKIILVPIR